MSKGFTKRNVVVSWTLITLTPPDDGMKDYLKWNLDDVFAGSSSYQINETIVENLAGKTLNIQATVMNYLGIESKNMTTLVFQNTKKLDILNLPDSVTFQASIENVLYPRIRIPYCSFDSMANMD